MITAAALDRLRDYIARDSDVVGELSMGGGMSYRQMLLSVDDIRQLVESYLEVYGRLHAICDAENRFHGCDMQTGAAACIEELRDSDEELVGRLAEATVLLQESE